MAGVLTRKRTGSALLGEFNDVLDSLTATADERRLIVHERIAELEAELADLRQLDRKLDAAVATV